MWKISSSFNDSTRRKVALSSSKKLSSLLTEIAQKNNGAFYCLNCLNIFRTKNKLERHKKLCENKDFCNILIPSEDTKILEFNQYQKIDKVGFIIYADL